MGALFPVNRKFLSSPGPFTSKNFIDSLCSLYSYDVARKAFATSAHSIIFSNRHLNPVARNTQVAPFIYSPNNLRALCHRMPRNKDEVFGPLTSELAKLGWKTDYPSLIWNRGSLLDGEGAWLTGFHWRQGNGEFDALWINREHTPSDMSLDTRTQYGLIRDNGVATALYGKVFDLVRGTGYDSAVETAVELLNRNILNVSYQDTINQLWSAGREGQVNV